MDLRSLLSVLGSADPRDGRNLTHEEAYDAFDAILGGNESEIRIAAFLMAMRWKGVTVAELTGFARAARDRANIPCREMRGVVCVCPPLDGYDTNPPLEVAATLITAGAGARVLLVTDKGVPPLRGLTAGCVLEKIGKGPSFDPGEAENLVRRIRFGAVSASGMLPALLSLRRVRGDVGVRTPLSTVEKLIVPESAAVVLGAQHGPVLGTAVETMAGLGHPAGIALQGIDGGVIPTLKKRTRGIELNGKSQTPLTVEPADFGLEMAEDPELPLFGPPLEGEGSGDIDALVNAASAMVDAVLAGESGAPRYASLLGAAVMLKASGRVPTLAEGVDLATTSLDSGAAKRVLDEYRATP